MQKIIILKKDEESIRVLRSEALFPFLNSPVLVLSRYDSRAPHLLSAGQTSLKNGVPEHVLSV